MLKSSVPENMSVFSDGGEDSVLGHVCSFPQAWVYGLPAIAVIY